jgi:tetratricopeptide (TPR) repeat protein
LKQPKARKPSPTISDLPEGSGKTHSPGADVLVLPSSLTQGRHWIFRLVALFLIPLLLLIGAELALRLAGIGYPTAFFIPGPKNGDLIENQQFGWRFFTPAAARTPRSMLVSETKPANTVRIIVFGESAAYGDPNPAYGFPRLLEVLLKDRFPGTNFEVINTAMTAINSHVILQIARDCQKLQADYWLIYMGNNEVVGPYGAGTVFGQQTPPLPMIRAALALKTTRIGQLLNTVQQNILSRGKSTESWGGMEMFLDQQLRPTDPRMPRVYDYFQRNLDEIIGLGLKAHARIILSTVAVNLKDSPPFASLHRQNLTPEESREWNQLYTNGIVAETAGKMDQAMASYQQAARIDDQFADLSYRWGRVCLKAGQYDEAARHLTQAMDCDSLRFRTDSHEDALIRDTAAKWTQAQVQLLDFRKDLGQRSPHGITGDEFLWEHVHFKFEGNYWLARGFAEMLDRQAAPGANPHSWLDVAGCATRLGLTDYNRQEMVSMMFKRLDQPPFTHQLDHAERYALFEQQTKAFHSTLAGPGFQAALAEAEQASLRDPSDSILVENYARLLSISGHLEKSLAQWRKVAELMPHYRNAFYQIGSILDELGRSQEALEPLEKALSLKPDSPEDHNALGLALVAMGRTEEGIRHYEKAIRFKPDFATAHVNWGVACAHLNENEKAGEHYRKALKLNPGNSAALLNLGRLLTSEGRISETISNYEAELATNPSNATLHINLGNVLRAAGQISNAMTHFTTALQLDSENAEAHNRLGFELARQGNDALAQPHFMEAVRLDPNHVEAHFNLGVSFAKQQNFEQAIFEFRECLRLDPNNATAKQYLAAAMARAH